MASRHRVTDDDRGGRATFYVTGMEHSPTGATGTAWGPTPWRAVQQAACVPVIEAALVVRVHRDHAMPAVTQDVRVSGLDIITARIKESLHSATCRKRLDGESLSADSPAHRTNRVASDVSGRTAQAESRISAGSGVATEGGQLSEEARSGCWRREKRAMSPAASGPHGSEGVTSPTRLGDTRKEMGPNRKSRLIHQLVFARRAGGHSARRGAAAFVRFQG